MKPTSDQQRKARGLLLLNKMLSPILKPTLAKRGIAEATILLDWTKIVGGEIASLSYPEKVTYFPGKKSKGTLLLNVDPSAALQLQYALDLIIDRINGYYGYKAISRIKLQQQPFSVRSTSPFSFSRKKGISASDDIAMKGIHDPELREALLKLARVLPPKVL